jgi:hypothetical protein
MRENFKVPSVLEVSSNPHLHNGILQFFDAVIFSLFPGFEEKAP